MTTAEARKKMRGTKRVCQSCAVPFYDLARDPIVCPACGAHYALDAQPSQGEASAPSSARKPPWGQGFKRPQPAPVAADEPTDSDSEVAAPTKEDGEEADSVADTVLDEDISLEQDQDDADVSDLLDREDVEDESGR